MRIIGFFFALVATITMLQALKEFLRYRAASQALKFDGKILGYECDDTSEGFSYKPIITYTRGNADETFTSSLSYNDRSIPIGTMVSVFELDANQRVELLDEQKLKQTFLQTLMAAFVGYATSLFMIVF